MTSPKPTDVSATRLLKVLGPLAAVLVISGGFFHVVLGGSASVVRFCPKEAWSLGYTVVEVADYADKPMYTLLDRGPVVRSLVKCGVLSSSPSPPSFPSRPVEPSVSASDFEILSFHSVRLGDHLKVVGEVRNNGAVAAGVELEATSRDANGVLVDSKKFWPNSVSNIPAGQTASVDSYVSQGPYAKTVDLKVASARVW